jgi:rhamnogalacturonan endolyase
MVAVAMQAQTTPVSQMEKLDRGVVALPNSSGSGKFVSWRFLGTDDPSRTTFNLKRNGVVKRKG